MRRNFLVITLATALAGVSFAQVQVPAQTVPASPMQGQPTTQSNTSTQPQQAQPATPTQPPNPVQTPTIQPQPQQTQQPPQIIPPPSQPLTPQEMQQLNQLVPPITGSQPNISSNMPPLSGLPNLPGSMMSKRDRVKNYTVLQRVGNIYVVSSPNNHTYVLRSDSKILRRYRCHIEYPYTYCAKKHKKAHRPKHGLY